MRAHRAPVAPQRQLQTALPRPRLEIRQVETENVVPLDHIRIPLPHQGDKFFQHRLLLRLIHWILDDQNFLPSRTVAQRNSQQRITRGIRHGSIRTGECLDIHLHPPHILEGHTLEKRPPALQQVLMPKVTQREQLTFVSRLGFAQGSHIVQRHDKLESSAPRQIPHLPPHRLRGPSKRLVHRLLHHCLAVRAPVNLHPVRRRKLHRHNLLGRVRSKEDRVVFDGGKRRSFSHGQKNISEDTSRRLTPAKRSFRRHLDKSRVGGICPNHSRLSSPIRG